MHSVGEDPAAKAPLIGELAKSGASEPDFD